MATYVYRCPDHGALDVRRPLGQAATQEVCPSCGGPARRVFTAPRLGRLAGAVVRAMDAAGATSDTPPVVASPPAGPARGRRAMPSPATARLPRP